MAGTTNTTDEFDVIVIGSGPGGYVCAIRAAQLGLKTACVEYEKTLGGTCLNVGCIPSKALLQSSEEFAKVNHELEAHGIKVGKVTLDLATMLKRKDGIVSGFTKGIEGLFKKNKVTWLKGRGSFVDTQTVQVSDDKGQSKNYKTRYIVIATGSKPVEIPSAVYDRKFIVSSTGALKFEEVPKHLIVVGGGVIGLEMGSVWMRLGAKVTVIEATDRLLNGMDPDCAKTLQRVLEKQGMEFHLGAMLKETQVSKTGVKAICQKGDQTIEVKADRMLVAVGRRANTEGLGLDRIGLTTEKNGKIKCNQHLQTSVPNVYVIGDVTDGPMLAHKAEDEGMAAAELIAGKAGHVNYDAIPNVVYTWPEVASVGLTEEQCKTQGFEVRTGKFLFSANGRAKALGTTDGFVKIIADAKTDRVLGAHMVGPTVSELISEVVVAMEFGASSEDIARTCHAHPTLSEVVREAALGVEKRMIHM